MGRGKLGYLTMVLMVMLVLVLGSSASRGDKQQRWRKAMISGEQAPQMVFDGVVSSIVFPLHGNVYPTGFYNVTLYIGNPLKPYFLDVDTGSDLTWLQCDVPCVRCTEAPHPFYKPSKNLVACRDPLCQSLHANGDHRCENPDQCDYEVEYADGGSSLGVLVKDSFFLRFINRKPQSPILAFGCGYDQLPGGSYHPIDGVLGLGRGKSSILAQLSSQGLVKNVIGHCLSGRGGGFLFFGDDVYEFSRTTWTPMSPNHPKHYSPGLAELSFGGETTGFKNLLVAFDSGSSYTYLNSQAYQSLLVSVNKDIDGKNLKEALDDQTLPFCWKGRRPFKRVRDVKKYFKSLALSFENSGKPKSHFELPPEAYLIISNKGNVCLGILNGTQVGLRDLNVIGDISMQDRMVIYDNEKQLIGWAPANCDRVPRSRSSII